MWKAHHYCVSFELLLGQYETYSRRQTSSLALPHQPSRPPRHDQYEICGLKLRMPPTISTLP
ncbi:MAG: hypothetical protein K9M81_04710 [Chthoniobacterales bacterium]|nr:hypothetical protein [Chthoniobacterales bacterium]